MKQPRYKRFNYEPRWYNPQEEKKRERQERIQRELESLGIQNKEEPSSDEHPYHSRIAGSFRSNTARRSASRQFDPSASLLRLILLLFLSIWLIAYLQFGNVALYALLTLIPLYAFLKLRKRAQ